MHVSFAVSFAVPFTFVCMFIQALSARITNEQNNCTQHWFRLFGRRSTIYADRDCTNVLLPCACPNMSKTMFTQCVCCRYSHPNFHFPNSLLRCRCSPVITLSQLCNDSSLFLLPDFHSLADSQWTVLQGQPATTPAAVPLSLSL